MVLIIGIYIQGLFHSVNFQVLVVSLFEIVSIMSVNMMVAIFIIFTKTQLST